MTSTTPIIVSFSIYKLIWKLKKDLNIKTTDKVLKHIILETGFNKDLHEIDQDFEKRLKKESNKGLMRK